jgi:nucleoside-diphosphate-sugar epimerase
MGGVLITGITGFLGSNLVRYFASNSTFRLFGFSRDKEAAREQYKSLPVEMVDSCSVEMLNRNNIDTVIHLAGIAHDLSNQYKDADYFRVNYDGTVKLYESFMKSEAKRFIFLSSIKAAVDVGSQVIDEEVQPTPSSPYGQSKLKAEQYIQDHINGTDKLFYLLRPCMVHGPGNKGNLNLLYKFVKTGLPYPLGAFQNQRSFLSVDNFNFVMDHLVRENIPSGIYNVADQGSLSTNELIRVMAQAMEKRERIWNIPVGVVRFLFSLYNKKMLQKLTENMVVSNAKVLSAIRKPLPVSIEEGLRRTVRSFNQS